MKYLKSIFEFLLESESVNKNKDKLKKELIKFEIKLKEKKGGTLYDDNFDNIIKILERDCDQFLREIKNSKSVVFRGFKKIGAPHIEEDNSILGLYKKERRRGRNALDLRPDLSDDLDDMFFKMFNFRLRSDGIFITKCPFTSAGYSDSPTNFSTTKKTYIFFPIGDYDYYWNPNINDLFSHVEDLDWYRYYNENEIEASYNNLYGDPRYNFVDHWGGNFKLNGVEIPHNNVIDYILNNYKDFGLEEPKNGYVKIGDNYINKETRLENIKGLNWIPDMTLEDFINSFKFDKDDKLNEIIKDYKSVYIEDVCVQEITFDCDHYYLLDEDYYFKLLEYLENKNK